MPQNITDVSTFTDPVVAPADGDARNAASVLVGMQALANRGLWNKTQFEFRMAEGIQHIQAVASVALLKAVTGMAHEDVMMVFISGVPTGPYVYQIAAVTTADDLFVIMPDTGVGRWTLALGFVSGAGAAARWTIPVANRIVSLTDKYVTANVSTGTTASYVDAGLTSDAITVAAGDKVTIQATLMASHSSGSGFKLRLVAHDGASAAAIVGSVLQSVPAANAVAGYSLLGYHSPGTGGTFTYRLQVEAPNAETFLAKADMRMLVTVVRP